MKNILLLLLPLLMLLSCNTKNNKKTTNPCDNEITFQLNWYNDPTFTGEYLAYEKFWKYKKLNVQLNEGGAGVNPISMIATKATDYAVIGADKAIIAISNGAPIAIVSVDFQRNPVGWIVRPNLNINKIADCQGRNDVELGDKAGTEVSSILQLMLKRKSLNVNTKSVSFDFSYFLTNENSIYPVYLNEEPVKANILHKINVVEIDPSKPENGKIELYGNVIITHEDKLKECPNEVKAIIDGISEGWKYALDSKNENQTLETVMKYVKGDKKYISGVIDRTLYFVTDLYGNVVPPGHMEVKAWKNTISVLKEAGLLKNEIDFDKSIKITK